MVLSLAVRNLLLASWPVSREAAVRALPPALEPAEVNGLHLVSIAAFRVTGGRVGRLPLPPFSQLNLRTYVTWEGEPAVFFVAARVTPAGMGGALFGAPFRPARLRLEAGRAQAPGLGLSLEYRRAGPGEADELGRHELGLFEAAGLRALRIHRGEAAWERAEPLGEPRADLLLAHGFDAAGPPSLIFAERASFEARLPPTRVR